MGWDEVERGLRNACTSSAKKASTQANYYGCMDMFIHTEYMKQRERERDSVAK
jgi:hypothetical protein